MNTSYSEMLEFENSEEWLELKALEGVPSKYKNINIYPVRVRDIIQFNATIGILTINKNETGNLEIVKMSYLDYLTNLFLQDFSFYRGFEIILELTIKAKNICFIADNIEFDFNKPYITQEGEQMDLGFLQSYILYTRYNPKSKKRISFTIGDVQYSLTHVQFEQLRKMICKANNITIHEEILPKKFRDALNKAKKYKNKNVETMSWGQNIMALASLENNSTNLEPYLNMPIFHFLEALKRHDIIQESVFEGIARRTGLVKIDKPITWLYNYKTNENELNGLVTDGSELNKMAQTLK